MRSLRWVGILGGALLLVGMASAFAGAASTQDFSDLKKEVEDLRARLAQKSTAPQTSGPIGRADALVGNKYGPNAAVTTKDGKLTIGGLLQVWAYSIQNDHFDYVGDKFSSNELSDNDGYRIRRAELKLGLDITPEITAVIMVDPTGGDEANTFPGLPTNQGVVGKGYLSGTSQIGLQDARVFVAATYIVDVLYPLGMSWEAEQLAHSLGFTVDQLETILHGGTVARRHMQSGFVLTNRFLQDAYINYHSDIIPHHDFTIGQFKPPSGEEAYRNSGQLDFVERAMINQFGNQRDLGIMVHGTWWDDRFQYWIGGFNSAGTFQNTFASLQNRSDDNDAKDIAWRLMLRPVWKEENWGSLEIGYARQDGVHGEAGRGYVLDPLTGLLSPSVDGLSLQETSANRQYAWAWYRPGGPVKGWWLRGEWGSLTDRNLPGFGVTNRIQIIPHVFRREGWYGATGYKLSESIWADKLKSSGNWLVKALHDFEFAYRYEQFGNLLVEDAVYTVGPSVTGGAGLAAAARTDVFKTSVHTFGLNSYWKGYNVRTQLNYMIVDESEGHNVSPAYSLGPSGNRIREVKNNIFVISQQVQW